MTRSCLFRSVVAVAMPFTFIGPVLAVLGSICSPSSVLAETFISIGGGVLFPENMTNITADENVNYPNAPGPGQFFPGTQYSDVQFQNSAAIDLKIGHFLDCHPWLGVEASYMYANPMFPEQHVTLTNPGFSIFGFGDTFTQDQLSASVVMNTLNFDLLIRYPGETFQPYVGVGPGILFTKESGVGKSGILVAPVQTPGTDAPPFAGSSTDIFLDVEAGLRVNLTETIYAYGEWQFMAADAHISNFRSISHVNGNFAANSMFFGLGIRFDRLCDLIPCGFKAVKTDDCGQAPCCDCGCGNQ